MENIFLYIHQFFSSYQGWFLGFLFFISKLIFLYIVFVVLMQGLFAYLPRTVRELLNFEGERKLLVLPLVLLYGFLRPFLSVPFLVVSKLLHLLFGEGRRPQGFMFLVDRFVLLNSWNRGLLLNGKRDRMSESNSFTHCLVVAKTGGGKSSTFIIPNLLTLRNCSILCTDLSGELYRKTAGYMKKTGFDIQIMNPENLAMSSQYNPLESLRTHQDILDLAHILITSSNSNPNDPFWNNGAKKLLELVISVLVSQREKLKQAGSENPAKYCHLANVRYLLNNFGKNGKGIDQFVKRYGSIEILNEWQGFRSQNERTTESFLSTALTALSIIGNPDIARLTSRNDFDFKKLRDQKTIVYLQIPQERLGTYSFLLSLFYAQFFGACFREMENGLPVYCLLDEAGHTKIPNLATTITTIRKYNVSISLILQSLTQLDTAYGRDEADTIIGGGINSQIYFAGLDLNTCKRLEQILGTREIKKEGREVVRPLMDAQTVRMMKQNTALYLFSNLKPTLLYLKPYYKSFALNMKSQMKPPQARAKEIKPVEYVDL